MGFLSWFAPKPQLEPTRECVRRIRNDLRKLESDDNATIRVVRDEENLTLAHAVLCGIAGTPYECGFFYFAIEFPPTYPIEPPVVTLKTTDYGRVCFNPNLYANGKVCLSILGTWAGPSWSPAQSLSSVLLSIQSLMHDRPFVNEPGREDAGTDACRDYNEYLRYETLRVACCENVEDTPQSREMPLALRRFVRERYATVAHLERCDELCRLTQHNEPLRDPTGRSTTSGFVSYSALRDRLRALHDLVPQLLSESETADDEIAPPAEITAMEQPKPNAEIAQERIATTPSDETGNSNSELGR